MDSSGSLTTEEWEAEKKFVQDISKGFDIGPNKVRVGLVEFSRQTTLQANFDKHQTIDSLLDGIDAIPKQSGGTRADRALNLVRTNLVPQKRPDVPLIIIVVTDGKSKDEAELLKATTALKASQPTIFSVGVGRIDDAQLKQMATSDDNVFTFDNFDQLGALQDQFAKEACKIIEAVTTTQPPPTTTTTATTTTTIKIPPQCLEHKTLENELTRSAEVISTAITTGDACDPATPMKCDSALKGWHRILPIGGTEGSVDLIWKKEDLAGLFRCGTKFPIYLNVEVDPLPKTKYETVAVKACLFFGETFETDCVEVDKAIEITNCGEFNVYNFDLPATTPCPSAYCTNTNEPCPAGTFSPSGFEPGCTDEVPKYTGKPVVEYNVCNPENELIFTCNDDGMTAENGDLEHFREIKWYMTRTDDVTGTPMLVSEYKAAKADFTSEDYNLRMGDQDVSTLGVDITCEIKGYTATDMPGDTATSDKFFAGVKAETDQVVIEGNDEAVVKITSTVPVICPKDFIVDGKCMADLRVSVITRDHTSTVCANGDFNGNIIIPSACGVDIPAVVPDPNNCQNTAGQTTELHIHGRQPDVYNGNAAATLILTVTNQPGYEIWKEKLPDILVQVINDNSQTANQVCQSNNDPHMITFTGRKYELQQAGTFVLYKHETLPLQVQATYQRCHPPYTSAFCNCGIAVQSGRDVFVYDLCKKELYNRVVQFLRVGVLGCDNKAMNVVKNKDNSYLITLPTGTKIYISPAYQSRGQSFVSRITITASTLDAGFNTIGGACGVIGSGRGQELKIKGATTLTQNIRNFFQSWKVTNIADNLLLTPQLVEDYSFTLPSQCECKPSELDPTVAETVCDAAVSGTKCNIKDEETLLRVCNDGKRKKRDIADVDIFADTFVLPDEAGTPGPTRPCDTCFPVGWTENKAQEYCWGYLNENAPAECLDLGNLDINFLLEGCVADIKAIGTTDFAMGNLQALLADCVKELVSNNTVIVTVDPSNPSTKPLTPSISPAVAAIVNKICPGACSMRGDCNAGTCTCNTGYGGIDCSVDLEAAPSNLFLINNGVCDLQEKNCDNTIVFGQDISTVLSVTCKIVESVFDGQKKVRAGAYTVAAVVMSEGQVQCAIRRTRAGKSAYSYDIALSNGEFASQPEEMVAFDSDCYSVDREAADKTPQLKDGMCVIDAVCHAADAINAQNAAESCKPDQNQFGWSSTQTSEGPKNFRDCFTVPRADRNACFATFLRRG